MFVVKLVGPGEGCDYTIGCNNITITLPESIKTMEEAVQYVVFAEEQGCLNYYGSGRVEKATIYEVVQSHEVDVATVFRRKLEILQKEEAEAKLEKEKAEFERLKAKFGR